MSGLANAVHLLHQYAIANVTLCVYICLHAVLVVHRLSQVIQQTLCGELEVWTQSYQVYWTVCLTRGHPPAKKDKVDAIPIVIATQEIVDESEYIHIHATNSISIHIQVYYSYLLEETSVFICNMYVQWNSSNPDTIGPEESVLIMEVSLFQGLKNTQTLGRKCPV